MVRFLPRGGIAVCSAVFGIETVDFTFNRKGVGLLLGICKLLLQVLNCQRVRWRAFTLSVIKGLPKGKHLFKQALLSTIIFCADCPGAF